MKSRIVIAALIMCVILSVTWASPAYAARNEENTASPWLAEWPNRVTPDLKGSGTERDPWLISDEKEFVEAYRYWQSCSFYIGYPSEELRTEKGKNTYFSITDDITLVNPIISHLNFYEGVSGKGWEGGGNATNRGTIEGNNHTITLDGFYTSTVTSDVTVTKRNLFSSNEGTIQNLTIVSTPPADSSIGKDTQALFIDYNSGTIRNCQVFGDVFSASTGGQHIYLGLFTIENSGTIADCTAKGQITSPHKGYFGGICAKNSGTVDNCSTHVSIQITNPDSSSLGSAAFVIQTGGITGLNASGSTLSSCKSQVAVNVVARASRYNDRNPRYQIYLGGIAGFNAGSISDSASGGTIYCEYRSAETESAKIDGIAGKLGDFGLLSNNETNIPSQSVSTPVSSGTSAVGHQGVGTAPDGKPNCILCNNTGKRECTMCHGDGTVISGDFLQNYVGPVDCLYCHGEGSVKCVCGR